VEVDYDAKQIILAVLHVLLWLSSVVSICVLCLVRLLDYAAFTVSLFHSASQPTTQFSHSRQTLLTARDLTVVHQSAFAQPDLKALSFVLLP
jgi:hypothetical protein